ncbi:MAG: RDD family protein, partial [Alphaproteobacteria bacterium]
MATTESAPLGLRSLVTPEGVPVHLELGDRGERAGAFLIDLMIMVLCLIGTYLVIGLGGLFV